MPPQAKPTRVLFACVHNAGRSQMAAALFNLMADPTVAHADSAGTHPAVCVQPEVVAALAELGLDANGARPRRLTPRLAATAQVLVTMGCGESCPVVPGARREDWPLADPGGQTLARVREIRDEIRGLVATLAAQLGALRPQSVSGEAPDRDLVAAALAAVPGAWALLVDRYRRLVYSVPLKMGCATSEAEEVFQDTFLALFEKLDTVRDRDRLAVWLAVTARRKTLNRLSRGPARFEVGLPALDATRSLIEQPLEALLALEEQNEIRAAFAQLPAPCRALLGALYYEDPPPAYDELARRLGVPKGSLGPTRLRCFAKLRRLLAKHRGRVSG